MYTSFFGLNEKPFAITPDPRYLYLSERHREALAHLAYGINESGGFVQLTGDVGTGKTTLIRSLLEQLPKEADVALILNPQVSSLEFLQTISEELGLFLPDSADSIKDLVDALSGYLLKAHARGRRTVLIVDEAQNLAPEVLEQVRLLTNLETARQKLLQIILIGQPELRQLLERIDLRQLAQRVTARYHLKPLSRDESIGYLQHRLKVAGANAQVLTPRAAREIYRLGRGVPRVMNVIADRALLGAYAREQRVVSARLARVAAVEVYGSRVRMSWHRWVLAASIIIAVGLVGAGFWYNLSDAEDTESSMAAATRPDTVAEPPIIQFAVAPKDLPLSSVDSDPEPAAEIVAPPPVDLGALLREKADDTGTAAAFSALFAVWGEEYRDSPGRACAQAEQLALYCLYQQGSWTLIRRLNRPVILTLTDEGGSRHQVLLRGLGVGEAELELGGVSHRVPLDQLSEYWYGDYLLLWRSQIGSVRVLAPGMNDEGILWLRQSLARIRGDSPPQTNSVLYDAELESKVREYQRERRLSVDGLVGAQTQIIINTDLASPGTPLLARAD